MLLFLVLLIHIKTQSRALARVFKWGFPLFVASNLNKNKNERKAIAFCQRGFLKVFLDLGLLIIKQSWPFWGSSHSDLLQSHGSTSFVILLFCL